MTKVTKETVAVQRNVYQCEPVLLSSLSRLGGKFIYIPAVLHEKPSFVRLRQV